MARKEAWTFITRAREVGIEKIAITTNGTLLSDNDIKCALQFDVRMQFSMDGNQQAHELVRGQGTYNKTMGNIKRCLKAGLRCDVLLTASKENYESAPDFIEELDALGVHTVSVLHFSPKGRGASHPKADFTREEWLSFINLLSTIETRMQVLVQPGWLSREQFSTLDPKRRISLCNWLKIDFAYVDIRTGDLFPCGLAFDTPLRFGTLSEASLTEAIDQHIEITVKEPEDCKCCDVIEQCRGGARCVAYWSTGELFGRDPRCQLDDWIPICPFVAVRVAGTPVFVATNV